MFFAMIRCQFHPDFLPNWIDSKVHCHSPRNVSIESPGPPPNGPNANGCLGNHWGNGRLKDFYGFCWGCQKGWIFVDDTFQ